jgi:hypothetical protein
MSDIGAQRYVRLKSIDRSYVQGCISSVDNSLVPSLNLYIEPLRLHKPAIVCFQFLGFMIIVGDREVKVANEARYEFGNLQHRDVWPNTCSSAYAKLEGISSLKPVRRGYCLLASSDGSLHQAYLYCC